MKVTFGRKFWAGLVGISILLFMFILAIKHVPESVTAMVIITYAVLEVTIVFMYIGGNIWNTWIKSKYFHSEFLE